jgi:hypothetical protein
MEHGKPDAYLAPKCSLENCQWYEEPYFAGVAISIDGFCHKIPGGTSISHYRSNQNFVESQFNVSV